MKRFNYILILLLAILAISCEDHFVGPGPQPNFFEDESHITKLNVFGIIRPDFDDTLNLSFIHIEKTIPAVGSNYDDMESPNTQVEIISMQDDVRIDSFPCIFTNYDSTFTYQQFRPQNFSPMAGDTYRLECSYVDLSDLSGETTIPDIPTIKVNSMEQSDSKIRFIIVDDTKAQMYDIYFIVGEKFFAKRILKPETGENEVIIDIQRTDEMQGELTIYAYDLNLSEYLTYNIYIKPNTYQPEMSTVDNGYGCFGSLNILKQTVNF